MKQQEERKPLHHWCRDCKVYGNRDKCSNICIACLEDLIRSNTMSNDFEKPHYHNTCEHLTCEMKIIETEVCDNNDTVIVTRQDICDDCGLPSEKPYNQVYTLSEG